MRWRKAHRNKNRALARERRRPFVFPYFTLREPLFIQAGWEKWLKMIAPNLINRDSIAARILSRPETLNLTLRTPIQLPELPPWRGERIDVVKYRKAVRTVPIFDDVDYPDEEVARGVDRIKRYMDEEFRLFMIVPDEPVRVKSFIYGDSWIAYRTV